MIKARTYILLLMTAFTASSPAQEWGAVKSNLLYDATTTFNVGLEAAISSHQTIELTANLNPWTFSNNKKIKHWLVQPAWRYWPDGRFCGTFVGFHAHIGQFNIHTDNSHRYQGWAYGVGASFGHHWRLGKRWHMEAELGLGYAYLDYDQYGSDPCAKKELSDIGHYVGPTRIALTILYMFGGSGKH